MLLRTFRGSTMFALVATALASQQAVRGAGQSWEVGRETPRGRQVSIDDIDHAPWHDLLQQFVDERGAVDYAAWKKNGDAVQRLDAYLVALSRADTTKKAAKSARLAFWINAYNATTVRGILREYPTSSIRNHTAKLLGYNIWDDLKLHVGSGKYSLNEMEHDILRKLGDPRIHFAIVCASQSCPRLLNEAYTAERLEEQLTTNTTVFFAQSGNFRYDVQQSRFQLSSILKWFAEDFGPSQAEQLRTIAPFLPSEQARTAALAGTGTVAYLPYDWSLNDQRD